MKKKSPWWIWMLAPMPVAAVVLVLVPPGQSPLEAAGPSPAPVRPALSMERRPMPVPIPLATDLPEAPAQPATKAAPSLPRTQAEVVQAREALKERERRLLARRAALNPVEREAIRDLISEIRSYNEDLRAFEAQAALLAAPAADKPAERTTASR